MDAKQKRRYYLTYRARKNGAMINTKLRTVYLKYDNLTPPYIKYIDLLVKEYGFVKQLTII
ncbi:MAG: hypothetical protein RR015_05390 [Bacteroidales bacterium]